MEKINISGAKEIIYKHTCSNGFNIYIWPYDLSDEISMSLSVKYGSLHTNFKNNNKLYNLPNGIAHFLEHVKFNEKEEYTANDFYTKIGSYANAFTTYEFTSYEVTCTKDVKTNLNHLLEYVYNPYFTEKLIEKEKGIIIEEARGSINNAYSKGHQELLKNLYQKNPRRNLITGTPEDVTKITLKDVKAVFDNFYLPDNMFLTVAGNINPDEVVNEVENFFKDKNYPKFSAEVIMEKEPLEVNKKQSIIYDNVNKPKVYIGYKFNRSDFKLDRLSLEIYLNCLLNANFGRISDFNDYLTSNNIVETIGSYVTVDNDNVVIMIHFAGDDIDKAITLVEDKINNLLIDDETFNRKKKSSIASAILGYDKPSSVVNKINYNIIYYDRVIDNLKEITGALKKNIIDDIAKIINNKNGTIVKIYDKK